MIIDDRGQLVWYRPLDAKGVTDFRVQTYFGDPVLTWWRGRAIDGVGDGYYEIMDDTYNPIATVTAGNGLPGDVHEFLITKRNTALITIYQPRPWDLSPVGGPKEGRIFDGVVQEVDIATGEVLFEWHSSDEIDVSESYTKPPSAAQGAKAAPMDYFHINSVDEEPDGNLLDLCAQHACDLRDRPAERQGAVAARRQEERLHDRARRRVHVAARRPAAAGRDADVVRQRRRSEDGGVLARPRARRRRRDEAGDARPQLCPSEAPIGRQPGERAVPCQRACLRRVGRATVLHRIREGRHGAARGPVR